MVVWLIIWMFAHKYTIWGIYNNRKCKYFPVLVPVNADRFYWYYC